MRGIPNMTLVDDTAQSNRRVEFHNFYRENGGSLSLDCPALMELAPPTKPSAVKSLYRHSWVPSDQENDHPCSWRRRFFLLLTEPKTSIISFFFFLIMMAAIITSCLIAMFQTMDAFQFTPMDCITCGRFVFFVLVLL